MKKLSVRDLSPESLRGKIVFLRVDFNVPIKNGEIQDDTRLRESLPTIHFLIERDTRVILASHLGRPKGSYDPSLSLLPLVGRLSRLLGQEVRFSREVIGNVTQEILAELRAGEVVLLENLRFHKGEEENDPHFARRLCELFDIYVNDAFAVSHRKHASVYGIKDYCEIKAAGFLLEREIKVLTEIQESPQRPFVVILGGAKVRDKLGVILNLMEKVDRFIIGGGMAYTFLKAKGVPIGGSIVDEENIDKVRKLLDMDESKFLLPVDHIVAKEIRESAHSEIQEEIGEGWIGVDIGPKTIEIFKKEIKEKGTLFWNGPMGIFEIPEFSRGTFEIARRVRESTKLGLFSIIGGGDTISSIMRAGLQREDFSYISTGGGATLEFLAGKELPGIEALTPRE